MSLPAARRVELEEKLGSLTADFEAWQLASADGTRLQKHQSQIARVTDVLGKLEKQAGERIPELTDAESARLLDRTILDLHRLWSYFRSKLLLRYVPLYEEPLICADELTWACYSCAQQAVPKERRARLKEPPLVFLNGAVSPFAASREALYEPERVPNEPVESDILDKEVRRLPIPVIGVPWYQVRHLPSATVLCHEVGHNIEADLGLQTEVENLIGGALEERSAPAVRRRRWLEWRAETWADVVGCAGAGSAFGIALLEFLSTHAARQPVPGYPSTAVRARISIAALEGLQDSKRGADVLRARWGDDYPVGDADREYADDADVVISKLVTSKLVGLGNRTLKDVLCFDAGSEDLADEISEELAEGGEPVQSDARLLHAAARRAFDADPEAFARDETGAAAMRFVMAGRRSGPRALRDELGVSDDDLAEADAALAEDMFKRLQSAHEEEGGG